MIRSIINIIQFIILLGYSKAATTFTTTISTLTYITATTIHDITTSKNGKFLLSPTYFTDFQAFTTTTPIFEKNSTQSDFSSLDCSEVNCAIGSKDGHIYYYSYIRKGISDYDFTNLGTYKISENLGNNKRTYITRILDKITRISNAILTAMESSYGVVRYTVGDFNNQGRFQVEPSSKLPIDLLHISNSNLAAVTYNHEFIEIFDITNMATRVSKFTNGGGFLSLLELVTPLLITLFQDTSYNLKILDSNSGTIDGSISYATQKTGVVSFRYSSFFSLSDPNGISIMKHISGDSPVLEYYHSITIDSVNGEWSKRNKLFRDEALDMPSWIDFGSTKYFGLSLKLDFIVGFINEMCQTSDYSLSAYCNTCTSSALKAGDICLKKTNYAGINIPIIVPPPEPETNDNQGGDTNESETGGKEDNTGGKGTNTGDNTNTPSSSEKNSESDSSSGGGNIGLYLALGAIVVVGLIVGAVMFLKPKSSNKKVSPLGSEKEISINGSPQDKGTKFGNNGIVHQQLPQPNNLNGKFTQPLPYNPYQPGPPQSFNQPPAWNNMSANNGFQPVLF